MSQQENEKPKKDLPNNEVDSSENQASTKKIKGNFESGDGVEKEDPAENSKTEANQLEDAMLDESEAKSGNSKTRKNENDFTDNHHDEDDPEVENETQEQQEKITNLKEAQISTEKPKDEEDEDKPVANKDVKSEGKESGAENLKSSENLPPEQKSEPTDTSSEESKEEENEEEEDKPVAKKDAKSEFEESVAEDSEDESTSERHGIEKKDYHSMSKKELVAELEDLISKQKVQALKEHVEEIRAEFNAKFDEEMEEKKEEFLAEGGNIIDFHYSTPLKKEFNNAYFDYKEKRNNYYQKLKQDLNKNLDRRLDIIEELKGLLGVEENINTTYKHFKELQESWRTAGAIPRDKYNNVWNTYHHHVENFYDFLHLNREFRDLDFKHNLEQKLKIIDRAEELTQETDTNRAFRELQMLHKMWKEELGPVGKDYREDIWDRFGEATKKIHDNRQHYYDNLEKEFEKNLEVKQEIIVKIQAISADEYKSHNQWQNKIKELEKLREDFFKAGKVPRDKNEETWSSFKQSVRQFNRKKNGYYKNLKKDQYDNLEKKKELIQIANDNKDSEDFKVTTPLMKKIQADWKNIGHVPRKDSDKVWKQFKAACNHYFDRMNASRSAENTEEMKAFDEKKEILDNLKSMDLTGDKKTDLPKIKTALEEWKKVGRVPYNKRFIEGKFNKTLDQLFNSLDVDHKKAEMMKYENKLQELNDADDEKRLRNEHYFLSKKVEESKAEIRQLENNLQFFSNVDDENPLVKDVHKNIEDHKEQLKIWKEKLDKIKSLY